MANEQVRDALEKSGLADRVIQFDCSSATVSLAARAAGVEEARIAKTLSFLLKDGCILLVTAGDARIDNGRFKARFGEKPRMLPRELVEEMTGHPVGGVCPFAVREGARVYLDESLRRFDCVYPAAGDDHSAVSLTCRELEAASGAQGWVDICKEWQETDRNDQKM